MRVGKRVASPGAGYPSSPLSPAPESSVAVGVEDALALVPELDSAGVAVALPELLAPAEARVAKVVGESLGCGRGVAVLGISRSAVGLDLCVGAAGADVEVLDELDCDGEDSLVMSGESGARFTPGPLRPSESEPTAPGRGFGKSSSGA